ncbi:MAG: hypothetical protein V6Z82_05665 [Flavobacteriales bacterium]
MAILSHLCPHRCYEFLNDSEGYKTRVIRPDRKFNTVSIINLGSLIGWGVDAATGALMKYGKKGYDIALEKDNRTSLNNPTKIDIDTKGRLVDVYYIIGE